MNRIENFVASGLWLHVMCGRMVNISFRGRLLSLVVEQSLLNFLTREFRAIFLISSLAY